MRVYSKQEEDEMAMVAGGARARSLTSNDAVTRAGAAIIFVSTIHSAQFVTELLSEMGILCTALHSAMSQKRRIASLGKFKSAIVPVGCCIAPPPSPDNHHAHRAVHVQSIFLPIGSWGGGGVRL